MFKKTISFIFLLFIFTVPATAASLKPIELAPGYNHTRFSPIPDPDDIVAEFRAYTSCFDGSDDDNGDGTPDTWGIPHWVSYEIKAYDGKLLKVARPSKWITDEKLNTLGLMPDDTSYHFSNKWRKANTDSDQLGYDRGHLCMKHIALRLGKNADWNTHIFYNAVPQRSDLNQGIWLDLEQKTEDWADEFGNIWVITGPIVLKNTPTHWLGQAGEFPVVIPDGFFKIVARVDGNKLSVLAFIYPQAVEKKKGRGVEYDHTQYAVSVDDIELLTGLDFFPDIPESTESIIEIQKHDVLW